MKVVTLLLVFSALSGLLEAEELPKLTVSGSASVKKPADQLNMSVGVVTQNPDVQKAVQANREKMVLVLEAVRKAGLTEKEYKTGTFQIVPQYEQPPKEPRPDWRPAIAGFEVRNTLTLQTSKIELAGPLIDAVARQGANLVEEIAFTLQDMQQAKGEAIALAVAQARAFAQAASKEAGVTLGDLLELSVNPMLIMPRSLRMEKFALAAPEAATPIAPGDVEVTATVSMIYAIRNGS